MIGAIAGDIIGSVYEHHPIKTTDFPLFQPRSRFTDDSVLTVALAARGEYRCRKYYRTEYKSATTTRARESPHSCSCLAGAVVAGSLVGLSLAAPTEARACSRLARPCIRPKERLTLSPIRSKAQREPWWSMPRTLARNISSWPLWTRAERPQ